MRWLIRRCCFYVFALWVAVTLNFLLPRLMPGDPAGGMLARLNPAQIQSNPGIIETYRRMLGGGNESLVEAVLVATSARSPTSTSASRPRTTRPRCPRSSGARCPIRSSSSAWPSSSRSWSASTIGMIAAWRRGGAVDNVVVPTLLSLSAFPAFFTGARRRLLLRPQARLVPAPARVRHGPHARLQLHVLWTAPSATRSCRSS